MSEPITLSEPLDFQQEFQAFSEAAPNWLSEIGAAIANA